MSEQKKIYCCGCAANIIARLTDGSEIYPNQSEMQSRSFWKCDDCGNYVGCQRKIKNRPPPLGCIQTPEIKKIRNNIRKLLDPIWDTDMPKKKIYAMLSKKFGNIHHTGQLRSVEEAEIVYKIFLNAFKNRR